MSKPKNLYEACEQVCEAIAARPYNYYQGSWAQSAESVADNEWCDSDAKIAKLKKSGDICGTAYCRAGWLQTIITGKPVEVSESDMVYVNMSRLLVTAGCASEEVSELFGGCVEDSDKPEPAWGSKAYVKAGVKGMRRFMTKYEKQLKKAKAEL